MSSGLDTTSKDGGTVCEVIRIFTAEEAELK